MKQQTEVMDERQKQITTQAVTNGFIFLVVCMVIAMVFDIAKTGDVGWELWGLIGASVVIIISRRIMGDVEQPKDIWNRPLPTGSSKQDRNARKKNYAADSAIFALVCAGMDILLMSAGAEDTADYELTVLLFPNLEKWVAVAVSAVIAFVSMFIISYIFDYLIGEKFTVKRYNKMIAELDSEE
jgi:membrane protein YdbS with pleckstrin-like domain